MAAENPPFLPSSSRLRTKKWVIEQRGNEADEARAAGRQGAGGLLIVSVPALRWLPVSLVGRGGRLVNVEISPKYALSLKCKPLPPPPPPPGRRPSIRRRPAGPGRARRETEAGERATLRRQNLFFPRESEMVLCEKFQMEG